MQISIDVLGYTWEREPGSETEEMCSEPHRHMRLNENGLLHIEDSPVNENRQGTGPHRHIIN